MHDWESLSHVRWDCKYHVVFVPKYRQKKLYGKFRRRVGDIFRDLCRQRNIDLLEGHLMSDHVHMCLKIPPKYSVSYSIGFLKGKSAVRIHRWILGSKKATGLNFWARGYCVSTVGLDEAVVRQYIRNQEKHEQQMEKVLKAEKIRNWWKLPSSNFPRPFLKFYEGGYNNVPKKQRDYKAQFSKSTSRYINWELNLSHPAPGQRIDFEIEDVYYRPDGNVLARNKEKSYVKSEWTSSWHNYGWGWKTPGKWPLGKYRVELYIKGEKVTLGSFEIVR